MTSPEIPVLELDPATLLIPGARMPADYRGAGTIQTMIDGSLTAYTGNLLHTTGNEPKAGVLTFADPPVMPDATVAGTSLLTRIGARMLSTARSVALGVAGLDVDGDVINAAGVKVLPGGGGATLNATLISEWGLRVWKYINYTTGVWPTRSTSLPAGYGTNFVHWFCLGYAGTFTVPPTMIDGDIIWRPFP